MTISEADYMALAKDFNPADFDARGIARLAKGSGMKWIIITSKHHEGFAMFKSAHPFNIVDATPFHRDPMKELAAACREHRRHSLHLPLESWPCEEGPGRQTGTRGHRRLVSPGGDTGE